MTDLFEVTSAERRKIEIFLEDPPLELGSEIGILIDDATGSFDDLKNERRGSAVQDSDVGRDMDERFDLSLQLQFKVKRRGLGDPLDKYAEVYVRKTRVAGKGAKDIGENDLASLREEVGDHADDSAFFQLVHCFFHLRVEISTKEARFSNAPGIRQRNLLE